MEFLDNVSMSIPLYMQHIQPNINIKKYHTLAGIWNGFSFDTKPGSS